MDSRIFKAKNKESGTITATLLAGTTASMSLTPVPAHAPGVITLRPGTAFEEKIYYKTRDAGAGTVSGLTRDYTNLNGGVGFEHTNGSAWETMQDSVYINNIVDALLEGYTQEQATTAYVSASSFTVLGDVTAFYTAGRILRANQDNTKILIVASSSYNAGSGLTTITTNYGTVPSPITHMELAIFPKAATNLFATLSGVQNASLIYAADSGGSDAYAITLSPAPTAYVTGQMFLFKANTVNTGAATLNVNGLGAKTIKKNKDQTLSDGDIKAGQLVLVQYDGTDLQMLSQVGNVSDTSGWNPYTAVVPTRVASNSYDHGHQLQFTGVDLSAVITKGMRFKLNQTPGSNTQSADLESGSSQYGTRADTASLSITGNIAAEAWINLESVGAGGMTILSKWNQDGSIKSYVFYVNTNDRKLYFDYSGNGSAETSCVSDACIFPSDVGKWIHVAVSVTVATREARFYKNGIHITTATGSGAQASIQDNATGFAIGCRDIGGTPDTFFDGKIAEVRLWNGLRTQNEIQANMYHNLVGNESGLAGYWKLNGDWNDTTANANNLTATGSPTFVASVPARLTNGTKYGIVGASVFSGGNTILYVDCGTDYGIDDNTMSSFYYSGIKIPTGFNPSPNKWTIEAWNNDIVQQNSPVANTYYRDTIMIWVPYGSYKIGWVGLPQTSQIAATALHGELSTSASAETLPNLKGVWEISGDGSQLRPNVMAEFNDDMDLTSNTPFYLIAKSTQTVTTLWFRGDQRRTRIKAVNSLL